MAPVLGGKSVKEKEGAHDSEYQRHEQTSYSNYKKCSLFAQTDATRHPRDPARNGANTSKK